MRVRTLQRAAAGLTVAAGFLPVCATAQLLRERAEDTAQVTATLASVRSLVQSVVVAEGAGAFQLANPNFQDEQVVLNPAIQPGATTRLFFESRLGLATTNQVARVEVSTNSGGAWSQVWSQAGTGGFGQGGYGLVNIPLGAFAGQTLLVRFRYDFTGVSAFIGTGTSPAEGWFIDDIQVGPRFEPRFHIGAGDPTPDEILLLEYINRARTNATAEALRLRNTTDPDVTNAIGFFNVNLDLMQAQFATLSNSLPPLAMNHRLLAAARLHSQDMFNGAFQSHTSSTNPLPPNQPLDGTGNRITRQGYVWQSYGENIYAYGESAWFTHAGFNIDWGGTPATGGMQSPPGHRQSIHSPAFREAGIGVVLGTNTVGTNSVGPMITTQDFASPQGGGPLLTGVAINDGNTNRFYDPGEGLGGVRIEVSGGSSFTISSTHGAFSLPLPGDGTHELQFRRDTWAPVRRTVSVTNGANTKADFLGQRLRVESLRRLSPTQARMVANISPAHSSLAVMRSGDLQSWTNTPHTPTTLTNGLLQIDVTLPAPSDRLFFRVESAWTNL